MNTEKVIFLSILDLSHNDSVLIVQCYTGKPELELSKMKLLQVCSKFGLKANIRENRQKLFLKLAKYLVDNGYIQVDEVPVTNVKKLHKLR